MEVHGPIYIVSRSRRCQRALSNRTLEELINETRQQEVYMMMMIMMIITTMLWES